LSPFTPEALSRIGARRANRGRTGRESGERKKRPERTRARVDAALSKPENDRVNLTIYREARSDEPPKPIVFVPKKEVPRYPEPEARPSLPASKRMKEAWAPEKGTVQFYVRRKGLIARSLALTHRPEKVERAGSAWWHPAFKPRSDGLPDWWSCLEWDAGLIPGQRKEGRRGARARF
jgi:hypothetical protein